MEDALKRKGGGGGKGLINFLSGLKRGAYLRGVTYLRGGGGFIED